MTNILQSKLIFLLLATALPVRIDAQEKPTCKTHNTKLPHPTDCAKYYHCFRNPICGKFFRFLKTCPSPMKFSVESNGCSSTSTCGAPPVTCGTKPFVCVTKSSYQFCVDGTAAGSANACPTGLICDTSCAIPCSLTSCLPQCSYPGIIGIPGDCTRFGICYETSPGTLELAILTCPVGFFDVYMMSCTQIEPVFCA